MKALAVVAGLIGLACGMASVAAYLHAHFLQATLLAIVAIMFVMGSGALWDRE